MAPSEHSESRVLVDLLQSLVSLTEWSFAEIWVPEGKKLVASAIWERKGGKFSGKFDELASLSRHMALDPGVCIAGKVWQDRRRIWISDLSSAEPYSPRNSLFQRAGLVSAAAWAIDSGNENDLAGVIVLMSHRKQVESEEHFEALEGMSMCCLPYLQQKSRISIPPDRRGITREEAVPSAEEQEDTGSKRAQVKYQVPLRDSSLIQRKPRLQERPVACMIQLKAALQKFPFDSIGSPNVSRTAVCWNMLEQVCEFALPWREVLSQIRDELRLALFSDDLMSTDDGLSLVRVPYFAQIPLFLEQCKVLNEKLSECMTEMRRISLEWNKSKEREMVAMQEIKTFKHRILVSHRNLIKTRLNFFLERRNLSAVLRKELETEVTGLRSQIQELDKSLKIEQETRKHHLAFNESEESALKDSLNAIAVRFPSMVACLQTAPIPADKTTTRDPTLSLPSGDTELNAIRTQLLILQNASLTEYELKHVLTHDNEALQNQHRSEFISRMDELQKEINELDRRIAKGFNMLQYDMMDAKDVLEARRETQIVARRASIFDSMVRSSGDPPVQSVEIEQAKAEPEVQEEEPEGQSNPFEWTEKELQNPTQINIWRGYEMRSKAKRELLRRLDKVDVLNLVYQVFEYKANADVASHSTLGSEFATTERAFYRFLEIKYGSKNIANLVAFDVLTAIDEQRDHVKMFQLFAMSMTGGWYDADWKYILRSQQFVVAVSSKGFANLVAVEAFLLRYMYRDAEMPEIQKFIKGFAVFPAYNRQLAQSKDKTIDESVSAEMFSEYIAHLLYMREEPKIRKVEIMYQVAKMDQHEYISYEQFENFVAMCLPVDRNVAVCQLYYRMLTKAHPTNNFPNRSLIHSVASCELETLMAYHSCSKELQLSMLDDKSVAML